MLRVQLHRWWAVSILVILPCGLVGAQPTKGVKPGAPPQLVIPPTVTVERDIQYGSADGRPLLLDMVRPKEPKSHALPVIAFIHGGGWSGGNKESALPKVIPYAASGDYLGVSIEYRLSGVARWPAQIHDCKAAIRWLKAHTAKYGINPEKIGVWGGSAGGHLVSMLGVAGAVKELEGDCGSSGPSSKVACVVDFCGPSDFLKLATQKNDVGRAAYGAVAKLLGGEVDEKQAAARQASPVTYVAKTVAPILVVHGTADSVVPLDQAELFHAALVKANADSTFIKMLGGGHGIGGPEIEQRVHAFLEKHLRGQSVEVSAAPITVPPAPPRSPPQKTEK